MGHWRTHDEGVDGPRAVDNEDQGSCPPRAEVFRVDRWVGFVFIEHLPTDVDLEGRIRRVWADDRTQEVLLRVCPVETAAQVIRRGTGVSDGGQSSILTSKVHGQHPM